MLPSCAARDVLLLRPSELLYYLYLFYFARVLVWFSFFFFPPPVGVAGGKGLVGRGGSQNDVVGETSSYLRLHA